MMFPGSQAYLEVVYSSCRTQIWPQESLVGTLMFAPADALTLSWAVTSRNVGFCICSKCVLKTFFVCAGSPGIAAYDEKNIRRRVYDALNVLMAMDIIIKDKKDISWKGLPSAPHAQLEKLKEERAALRQKILNQQAYLQVIDPACSCLAHNLLGAQSSGQPSCSRILPFSRPACS